MPLRNICRVLAPHTPSPDRAPIFPSRPPIFGTKEGGEVLAKFIEGMSYAEGTDRGIFFSWYCTVTCHKYLRVVFDFFVFENPYYILQHSVHAKSSWIKRDYPSAS
jgi:hypothetical protein